MDKNDIIEYVMNTPHNTNRAVLSSMLNQLAEDGGGGSSDFSTATLTVVNNASGDIAGQFSIFPVVVNGYTSFSRLFVPGNSTQTYTVVIGENGCKMLADGEIIDSKYTLSGDITLVEEELGSFFIITGDCTITISE